MVIYAILMSLSFIGLMLSIAIILMIDALNWLLPWVIPIPDCVTYMNGMCLLSFVFFLWIGVVYAFLDALFPTHTK